MFVIQGDLQGQKVKVNCFKNNIKKNTNSSKCNACFYVILNRESICGDSFCDSRDILNIQK